MRFAKKVPNQMTDHGQWELYGRVRDLGARVEDLYKGVGAAELAVCPFDQNMRWLAEFKFQGSLDSWILTRRETQLTCITLKSFVTTVATPLKNVGRLWPSI
jgi:hypothetical protein